MWIMSQYGFYSIVRSASAASVYLIRARRKDQLISLTEKFDFTDEKILTTNTTDYRFRLVVTKEEMEKVVLGLASEIDYSNFKDRVRAKQGASLYERLLHEVWYVMRALQGGREEKIERKGR